MHAYLESCVEFTLFNSKLNPLATITTSYDTTNNKPFTVAYFDIFNLRTSKKANYQKCFEFIETCSHDISTLTSIHIVQVDGFKLNHLVQINNINEQNKLIEKKMFIYYKSALFDSIFLQKIATAKQFLNKIVLPKFNDIRSSRVIQDYFVHKQNNYWDDDDLVPRSYLNHATLINSLTHAFLVQLTNNNQSILDIVSNPIKILFPIIIKSTCVATIMSISTSVLPSYVGLMINFLMLTSNLTLIHKEL